MGRVGFHAGEVDRLMHSSAYSRAAELHFPETPAPLPPQSRSAPRCLLGGVYCAEDCLGSASRGRGRELTSSLAPPPDALGRGVPRGE